MNTTIKTSSLSTSDSNSFSKGALAAVPISIGYVPVAMTFGAACIAAGLEPWQAIAMSIFIYSGATQFILLAAIQSGTELSTIVILCIAISCRHLLYGPLIVHLLPKERWSRILRVLGLTDEVFAVSLTYLNKLRDLGMADLKSERWFSGLAVFAYAAWVGGTALGAWMGASLAQSSPIIEGALKFAFPAMFLALALQCLSPETKRAVLVAALVAGTLTAFDLSAAAILGGAFAGVLLPPLKSKKTLEHNPPNTKTSFVTDNAES